MGGRKAGPLAGFIVTRGTEHPTEAIARAGPGIFPVLLKPAHTPHFNEVWVRVELGGKSAGKPSPGSEGRALLYLSRTRKPFLSRTMSTFPSRASHPTAKFRRSPVRLSFFLAWASVCGPSRSSRCQIFPAVSPTSALISIAKSNVVILSALARVFKVVWDKRQSLDPPAPSCIFPMGGPKYRVVKIPV